MGGGLCLEVVWGFGASCFARSDLEIDCRAGGNQHQELLPEQPGTDVLQLWHLVNDCVGRSAEFARRIGRLFNYDSVRHRFKGVFGASPTQLLIRLRMQKARNLLLEIRMSIKEIAVCLGYERQHEFARTFRRNTGQIPSECGTHLFPKNASFSSKVATPDFHRRLFYCRVSGGTPR